MSKLVLVTGGAGHIGSHLVEKLASKNSHVISLDDYSNGSAVNHVPGVEYRRGHTSQINKLIPESPNVVFHLGEYARISTSFKDIDRVLKSNRTGTQSVLEFCRQRKVDKLVYAASSTKFAEQGEGRYHSPYTLTKAHNSELVRAYGVWYKLPYAICYFYNVFGGREKGQGSHATLIARFQAQYLAKKPLTVVKPGTQKRNFTYIDDVVRGIILTAEKGRGDGYALNNPNAYSVLQIAEAFGGPIKLIDGDPGRSDSGEAPTKARDELGWSAKIEVMDYIRQFVKENFR